MTSTDILILTLVGVLALAFLVFAGLALSVRSFTALTELIARLGLQVVQQHQENQQAQTTLLAEVENVAKSVQTNGIPTTPGNQESSSRGSGTMETQ